MVRLFARKYLAVVPLLILALARPGGADTPDRKLSASKLLAAEHRPGELVVRVRGAFGFDAAATTMSHLASKLGSGSVKLVSPFQTDSTLQLVTLSDPAKLADALATLREDPAVEIAEPNFVYHATRAALPDDPGLAQLWGILNTGQKDSAGQYGHAG